jgi:hypothetical protein
MGGFNTMISDKTRNILTEHALGQAARILIRADDVA